MNEELLPARQDSGAIERPAPEFDPGMALKVMIDKGITAENVTAVKELAGLYEHMQDRKAQQEFAKALFRVRKSTFTIEADKSVKDRDGKVTFTYASEREIMDRLDPVLLQNGFTTLSGQTEEAGKITISITLIHEAGHQESRSYTVRTLQSNSMLDPAKADAGAATLAWRHLVIKMFGLKSHIVDSDDARVEGEKITAEQAEELEHRAKMVNANIPAFLKFAGAPTFAEIRSVKYQILDEMLRRKEQGGK